MYKVIIAERDMEYIRQLQGIITKEYRDCQIINIVGSSREVIELLNHEDTDIDIAIINVKLTGVNGLEAIKKIRQKNVETRIIILSEFGYLEFAKEAIRLKADSYITMPASDYELSEAIDLCLKEIVRIEKYRRTICSVTSEYQEAKQYIEYSYIYSVVFSKLTSREIKKYVDLLGISMRGCMVNLELESEDMRLINKQTVIQQIYECIHEHDSSMFRFVFGPRMGKRIILYVSYNCEETEENKEKLKELLNAITEDINMKLSINIHLGIGKVEEISNIYASYQDAIRSFRVNRYTRSNLEDSEEFYNNLYKDLEKKYLKSLRLND
ncbi:response regulator [Anaerosporobacter sp.]